MSRKKYHESKHSPYYNGKNVARRTLRMDRVAAVAVPIAILLLLVGLLCLQSYMQGRANQPKKKTAAEETTTAVTTQITTETAQTTEKQTGTVTTTTGLLDAFPVETKTTAETQQSGAAQKTEAAQTTVQAAGGTQEITVNPEQVSMGDLILINSTHELVYPTGDSTAFDASLALENLYENATGSYGVSEVDLMLNHDALAQLNAWMDAYAAATNHYGMEVFAGYRDKEDIAARYAQGYSAFDAGFSDYHSGRTVNIKINFPDGTSDYYSAERYPDYAWLSDHAAEYGYIVRYPAGKDDLTGDESNGYTFRYVGVAHALYMKAHDLCLEEYLKEIQQHTPDNPLVVENGTQRYEVAFIAMGNQPQTLTLPAGETVISGDNAGGVVITVKTA